MGSKELLDKVLEIIEFEDKWLHDAKSHNANTNIAFHAMYKKIITLRTQAEKRCFDCKWFPDNGITKSFGDVCFKCSNSDMWKALQESEDEKC